MDHTKEQLTPICLQLFNNVRSALPEHLGERLTCSRAVRNHGSYRTVLLFNVWDKYQSDVLPKQHFCYCLGYDPKQLISGGSDWYFHLWLNTIRIYRDRVAVQQKLEKQLRDASPKGFRFFIGDRDIQAKINFSWDKSLVDLPDFLLPKYVRLIESVHPVLVPIIDRYSIYGRAEVKSEVATRGRIPHRPLRTAHPELVEEYSRSIPPVWRQEILEKHSYKCVHCGEDLSGGEHHMDHIIPFTKGGKRIKTNFQPLCPACNLKKGNRFIG
jgi:5-methylcytosine-specific restriction endonuclease McrA